MEEEKIIEIEVESKEVPIERHFYFGLVRYDTSQQWFPTSAWSNYNDAVRGLDSWTGVKEKGLIKVVIPKHLLE